LNLLLSVYNTKPLTSTPSSRDGVKAIVATSQTQTQNGAPTVTNASTSPTEKPGLPTLLGIAVENGAITNSVSGNTMTLSTTLFGLITGFHGDEDQVYKDCYVCTRLGGSATFNLTSTTDTLNQATRKQISQWQTKYTFRDTSLRSPDVDRLYAALVGDPGDQLAKTQAVHWIAPGLAKLEEDIRKTALDGDPLLVSMAKKIAADKKSAGLPADYPLTDAQNSMLASTLLDALDQSAAVHDDLDTALQHPEIATGVSSFSTATKAYLLAHQKFMDAAAKTSNGFNGALTFGQQFPTTSTSTTTMMATNYLVAGGIISFQPGGAPMVKGPDGTWTVNINTPSRWEPAVTANFSSSFYTNPVASANEETFRGAMASVQSQWKLGKGPFITDPLDKSQTTVSISGNYTRLQENSHQAGKKADIALGNFKFELPIAAGISFPLSFTVANSSELVKETYVKGNFGVSFDLSALSALLHANKSPAQP
jgi:hypothetical protein